MEHKTGTFAELWGLSPEGLKFYIKKGLLDPAILGKYRVYSYKEASILHRLLYFRAYGFSLEEARELCFTDDLSGIREKLRNKTDVIQEEMKRRQRLLDQLQEDLQDLNHIERQLGEISVMKMPLVCVVENSLEENRKDVELFSDWTRYLPFAKTNYLINLSPYESNPVQWGMTVPLAMYEELSQEIGKNEIRILGGVPCLHAYLKDHDEKGVDPRILEPLLTYAQRHNYQLKGYALINFTFILQSKMEAEKTRYLECFLPIQEEME